MLELQLTKEGFHLYLQVGTTSSTAVDPLLFLGKIAKVTYLTELMRQPTKRYALLTISVYCIDLLW